MSGSWWKGVLFIVAVFPLNATALADGQGIWISDPSLPGPDQPPVGRSLFDYLFTESKNGETIYAIPFPFSRLVERIEQELPEAPTSGNNGIRQVLIPMGRSLVRNASRGKFFTNPRLVLAVDAHPRFDSKHAGLLLKDRLYIGYMESAQLLEVISYNEAAGRFEFQLVENYGPGSKPKVRYAKRQLCIACHQNAAPVFSRQQWDETNANPEIDELLIRQGAARYGIPEGEGVDIPFAIDSATDRANYFTYYQLMWQKACQPFSVKTNNAEQVAVTCRAALLRAVLQYVLGDGAGFDQNAVAYQKHFRRIVRAIAAQRWPDGLKVPNADIPNRNPLLRKPQINSSSRRMPGSSVFNALDSGMRRNDGNPGFNIISEVFDPLVLRPPLKWLDTGSDAALQQLVSGLAGFIAEPDRQRLDKHLFDTATEQGLVDRQELSCEMQEKTWTGQGRRFAFDCRASSDEGLVKSLRGRFTFEQEQLSQATVNHLSMTDGDELQNLAMQQTVDGTEPGEMRFRINNGNLHARLSNGNALGDLVLKWQVSVAAPTTVQASLSVLKDFSLVDKALSSLVQSAMGKQTDALSDMPFRRASIMPVLFGELGMGELDWCCIDPLTVPVAIQPTTKYQEIVELKPFYQFCAACHASTSPFPANFLYGDEAQVRQQVSHCAERIYYRLSMLQKKPGNRAKSPMPPANAWADSRTLNVLKDYVGKLLQQQGEGWPDMEQFERRGFDQLRSCLPSGKI